MIKTHSNLLMNDKPLVLSPTLACIIGLNEALLLQQTNYWMAHAEKEHGGRKWIYKTYDRWQKQDFPFWSVRTIKRIVTSLVEQEILLVEKLADNSFNRVNHYAVNYNKLDELHDKYLETLVTTDSDKLAQSNVSLCHVDSDTLALSHSDKLAQSHSDKLAQCLREQEENKKEINIKDITAPKKSVKNKTSYPDDFEPTEKQIVKCAEHGIDIEESIEAFCDHHTAKGSTMVCWSSAFNTWIRNQIKFNKLTPIIFNGKGTENGLQRNVESGTDKWRASIDRERAAKYGQVSQPSNDGRYNGATYDMEKPL